MSSEYMCVELNLLPVLLAILHFSVYAAVAMAQRANILTNQRAIMRAFKAQAVIIQSASNMSAFEAHVAINQTASDYECFAIRDINRNIPMAFLY